MSFLEQCDEFFKNMFTDLGKACLWIIDVVVGILSVFGLMFMTMAGYLTQLFFIALPIAIIIWFIKLLL